MIQVACISCRENYDVDERRIPASGMRMRCPKCGTSFVIAQDGTTKAAPAGPPPPPPPPGAKPRIAPPVPADLPAPKGAVGFDLDLPAPKASGGGFGEMDLPAPKASGGGFGEMDLPAPKASGGGFGELDLPAPKGASAGALDFDLPAPKAPAKGLPDLDLPAPKASGGGFGDFDLPAPKASGGGFGEADLPRPKQGGLGDLDLPRPKAGGFGDLDLPQPKAGGLGDLDLPRPKAGGLSDLDLPRPKAGGLGDLDLPIPRAGGGVQDLPRPKAGGLGDLDFPVAKGGVADLPMAKAGFELDLPSPKGGIPDLAGGKRPMAAGGEFEIDMPGQAGGGLDDIGPTPSLDLDAPDPNVRARGAFRTGQKPAAAPAKDPFGELDLGGPKPAAPDPFGELDLGGPKSAAASGELDLGGGAPAGGGFGELDLGGGSDLSLPEPRARKGDVSKDGRVGAGGTGFGELDLGGGGQPGNLDDALEFGGLGGGGDLPGLDDVAPIVRESTVSAAVSIEEKKAALAELRKRRGRNLIIGTVAVMLVGGGVGYAMKFTPYGAFGQYALEAYLPSGGDAASVQPAIVAAERKLVLDTYADTRAGLVDLARARGERGLNRTLLARSLLHEAYFTARFGGDSTGSGRMNGIASRLRERSEESALATLGFAAVALSNGDGGTAALKANSARRALAQDPYVDLILGEAALLEGRYDDAVTSFRAAERKRGGARALWGVARALMAKRDDGAGAAVDATLAASPNHVEARIEKARRAVLAGELADALALAREAAGMDPVGARRLRGSRRARAAALVIVGRVEELRSNRVSSKAAYDAAAQLDGFNLDALVGSGRVMLEGLQPREALVRFQSALEIDSDAPSYFATEETPRPLVVEARFGAIGALLALDRPQEALTHIAELATALPNSAEVETIRGRIHAALHQNAEAEAALRRAIELAPDSFEAYLSLANFLYEQNRPADAIAVLRSAEGHVTITAEVRRLEGQLELQRNQLASAREKFLAALALDPNDFASRFMLGVAFRREGLFADAARELDLLMVSDPGYPGLALERGLIFESMGRSDEAVRMYLRALDSRPEDIDLRIRLGGAQVAAGLLEDGERTLRAVLETQANNATAIHYIGRLELARNNVDAAIEQLQTAARLEPARAEFHAWLAAAFIERNNLAAALSEIRVTLERDPSSVDGHILNARVLARSGHIDEALAEVHQALTVDPRRLDAWAVVGECEEQRGRREQAVAAYRAALGSDPSRGDWWRSLARVQVYVGDIDGGMLSYRRAAELGDGRRPRPAWSYDSWRSLGDVAADRGDRATAAEAYRRYLETAPPGASARNEVQLALSRL